MIKHFGLRCQPFTRELTVKDRMKFSFIEAESEALLSTIKCGMSGALIAPAGAGKTVVLRTIQKSLPEARYRIHYVKVTGVAKRDMCREICAAIGAPPAGTYPALVRSIQSHFENTLDVDGLRPVMLIDESHEMPPPVLAMLRLLTNFAMDSRLVVSFILAGQTPLKELLKKDSMGAIASRLAHCGQLRLLSRSESRKYLEHRMRIAGTNNFPFDDDACEALFEITCGNLRALDQASRKALEIAALAKAKVVDPAHVMTAKSQLPN